LTKVSAISVPSLIEAATIATAKRAKTKGARQGGREGRITNSATSARAGRHKAAITIHVYFRPAGK
jgi:hypothetical protein